MADYLDNDEDWYEDDYYEGLDDIADAVSYTLQDFADIITSSTGRIRRRNPAIQSLNPYINPDGAVSKEFLARITIPTTNQKGNVMDLNQKAELLQQQMNELLRQLAVLNRFPKVDPCIDGQVILFAKKFSGTELPYLYAAIRTAGRYYLTGGKTNPQGYTWDSLVEWMGSKVESIILMSAGRELMNIPGAVQVSVEPPKPMTDEEHSKDAQNFDAKGMAQEYIDRPRAIFDNPQA